LGGDDEKGPNDASGIVWAFGACFSFCDVLLILTFIIYSISEIDGEVYVGRQQQKWAQTTSGVVSKFFSPCVILIMTNSSCFYSI
jgi:hypothetical protein